MEENLKTTAEKEPTTYRRGGGTSFWKIFGASLLAIFVSSLFSWIVYIIFFFSIADLFATTDMPVITPQTVVKIDFAENISEAPTKDPMAGFDINTFTIAPNTHLLKVL